MLSNSRYSNVLDDGGREPARVGVSVFIVFFVYYANMLAWRILCRWCKCAIRAALEAATGDIQTRPPRSALSASFRKVARKPRIARPNYLADRSVTPNALTYVRGATIVRVREK